MSEEIEINYDSEKERHYIGCTRYRVIDVVAFFHNGLSPDEIIKRFSITKNQLKAAMIFYIENSDYIKWELSDREKTIKELPTASDSCEED